VVIVPAALALAERDGVPGTLFLQACVIGAELSIRVGQWLGRAHYDTGFHQTATAGAFGAAAAAGHVLRLTPDRMQHALGLAAARAAGLKSQFGTMGKPYAAGMAAATGVEAALLAKSGFQSRPDALECSQGFGDTHAGAADASALDDLGDDWRFDRITHKYHACCHGTHAAIEALNALSARVRGQAVDSVRISVHPSWLRVCNIDTPQTGLEAKFSLKLTAAMAIDGRDTGMPETFCDTACRSARLTALAERVRVTADDNLDVTAARVAVTLADGRDFQAVHDLKAPIAMPDRATRLRGKARSMLGDPVFNPIWDAITTQEKPGLPALLRCLSGGCDVPAVTGT